MPSPESDCWFGSEVIETTEEDEFISYCRVGSDVAAACLVTDSDHFIAVLAPNVDIDINGEPVVHESLHALHYCTPLATRPQDVFDSDHSERYIWETVRMRGERYHRRHRPQPTESP